MVEGYAPTHSLMPTEEAQHNTQQVGVISEMGNLIPGVSSFYISFIVTPFASNASEVCV